MQQETKKEMKRLKRNEYTRNYHKENYCEVCLKFNKNNPQDMEIMNYLKEAGAKNGIELLWDIAQKSYNG